MSILTDELVSLVRPLSDERPATVTLHNKHSMMYSVGFCLNLGHQASRMLNMKCIVIVTNFIRPS